MVIESFQKLIDNKISEENAEPRVSSGKFNPSYLGMCHRKHYWKRSGEEQTNGPDDRAFRVFKCGHLFEAFVSNCVGEGEKQVKIETDDFLGYADIVTENEVIDVKSINSRAFWYMDKETYDINKEKRQNILQVIFYAKQLGKPKARLVFISKDDLCIREYGFFVDAWEEALAVEIDALKKAWADQALPEADPQASWECGTDKKVYCPYYDKCKSVGGKVWEKY